MLTNENKLLHTVAIGLVPVASESFFACHELFKFLFRHGCIPLTGIAKSHLSACLFKHIAGLGLVFEPAYAFAPNDCLWPLCGNKLIKSYQVKRLAAIVNKCTYAVFFNFSALMIMVMMVVMSLFVLMFVVMMLFMVMVVMIVFVLFFLLIHVLIAMMMLDFINPGC